MQESELRLHSRLEQGHWWFRARREIIAMLADRYVRPHGGGLLDIGCGSGGNLAFLRGRFREASGLDVSPAAAQLSHAATGADIHVGAPSAVPASVWANVDLVLLADVLEHVEQDRGFLQDVIGRLPAGAILIITVPAHPHLYGAHDRALGHYRRYDWRAFTGLWHRLDADCLFASPFNCLLFPLMLLVRKLKSGEGSDLREHSFLVNALLYHVFRLEKFLLSRMALPWGASYLCVLQKQ